MADEVTKKTPAEEAAEHIIPESKLEGKGVSAQSNPMELPEDEAKAVFDQIAKEIIIPAYNAFVQFVAAQFGLIDWTTDANKPISIAVQTALTNMDNAKHDKELRTGSTEENPVYRVLTDNNLTDELKRQLESAYKKEHEHSNKKLLDGLTDQDIRNWNGENVLTKNNTKEWKPTLPFHPATVAYVDEKVVIIGAADMQKRIYDPNGHEEDIFAYAKTAADDAKYIIDEEGTKWYWAFENGALCLKEYIETEEVSE
ncbi:hypothetical protein [Anaerotignum sp.]